MSIPWTSSLKNYKGYNYKSQPLNARLWTQSIILILIEFKSIRHKKLWNLKDFSQMFKVKGRIAAVLTPPTNIVLGIQTWLILNKRDPKLMWDHRILLLSIQAINLNLIPIMERMRINSIFSNKLHRLWINLTSRSMECQSLPKAQSIWWVVQVKSSMRLLHPS